MMSSDAEPPSLQDAVTSRLLDVTRTAGRLANADLSFLRSTDATATQELDRQNARILKLTRRLCQTASQDSEVPVPELSDLDALEDNWQGVVDMVDHLLENASSALDEARGVVKQHAPDPENATAAPVVKRPSGKARSIFQSSNIPKPQRLFKNPPRNEDTAPFRPLLRSKPHALVSLEECIGPQTSDSQLPEYKHPYEQEIKELVYPSSTFVKAEPIPFTPFETSSAIYVDTQEAVMQMLEQLKEAREIAIDLEHHDAHTFIGLTSLMQISTRDQDWIIDTLKPWREDLQVLNEVFADPRILKVLHGAAMDIIWLQRDLGLYVVGLLDTYEGCVALQYPRRGLAYLLSKFVNFTAQKQHQLADWRIRPLPKELLDYARSDTHFLLYVYDCMRNELVDKSNSHGNGDLVATVLQHSKETSLQRYERPKYDAERGMGTGGWYGMLVHSQSPLTREQLAVFRAVHAWRDKLARVADESPAEILNKAAMFRIASDMPLNPTRVIDLLGHVPQPLKPRLGELAGVVRTAKWHGAEGPDLKEMLQSHPATIEREERLGAFKQAKAERERGVAHVLQREREGPGADALMATTSLFWGPTVSSDVSDSGAAAPPATQVAGIRLHVPLPALTAEVFSSTAERDEAPPASVSAPPEHAFVKPAAPPTSTPATPADVIILREQGAGARKRKSLHDAVPSPPSSTGAVALTGDVNTSELKGRAKVGKNARKKARKLAMQQQEVAAAAGHPQADQNQGHPTPTEQAQPSKKQKKKKKNKGSQSNGAGNGQQGGANEGAGTEEPVFEYTHAPSVLNAVAPKAGHSGAKKSGFNPYSKSLNASKGVKAGKQGSKGKSATFLS